MFKSLFGQANPTHKWPPHGGQLLTLDLDAGSLNDVALGQPLEQISFLGPDEDRKAYRHGQFCYYSRGLCLACHGKENTITSFQIVFGDPEEGKYRPFTGRVLRNAQPLDLATLTTDNCTEVFGDYYWLDRDEDESIMFYEFPGREWQLEFDNASALKRFVVTNRPLMADADQREAYEVTKPWPPAP